METAFPSTETRSSLDGFATASSQRTDVLVYYDKEGVDATSARDWCTVLQEAVGSVYHVSQVDSGYLRTKKWEDITALLVMPGGVCSVWDRNLGEEMQERVNRYVREGGSYLGVCAGAYWACSKSVFSGASKRRNAKLSSATAVGPLFGSSNMHNSGQEAAAAPIVLAKEYGSKPSEGRLFYKEGCRFDVPAQHGTTVLAHYKDPSHPAIIGERVGKGVAVLCGVHPEHPFRDLSQLAGVTTHFQEVMTQLDDEPFRSKVLAVILQALQLSVQPTEASSTASSSRGVQP